mmetsp:Transcript_16040/g.61169  ORF Transcript_16040/g.61169 Transcript_16040/m.61169 type:complete len:200 (+) Transcript_16040:2228-2827(+)
MMSWKFLLPIQCWTFRFRPVNMLSTTMTSWPSNMSKSTRWEPTKPAPPVTSTRSCSWSGKSLGFGSSGSALAKLTMRGSIQDLRSSSVPAFFISCRMKCCKRSSTSFVNCAPTALAPPWLASAPTASNCRIRLPPCRSVAPPVSSSRERRSASNLWTSSARRLSVASSASNLSRDSAALPRWLYSSNRHAHTHRRAVAA